MIESDELISLDVAARRARCSIETLRRAHRKKLLKTWRAGRKIMTTWNSMLDYMELKEQPLAPTRSTGYTIQQDGNFAGTGIIPTGEIQAVVLRNLHARDILYLDRMLEGTKGGPYPNGGFARFLLEFKRGVCDVIEMITTSKPENRK